DGRRISAVDNPGEDRAWWVFGIGQERVWVVGEHGLALARTGSSAFKLVATGTDDTIYGAWGPTAEELYFVTGSYTSSVAKER
ncbi:hypothetical protein ACI3PL_28325, partial [Lacticaseibacillus paracasei]